MSIEYRAGTWSALMLDAVGADCEAMTLQFARTYTTQLEIGSSLLTGLGEFVRSLPGETDRCTLVSDESVGRLYSEPAMRSLYLSGVSFDYIELPCGEASKSLVTAERLLEELQAGGFERRDLLIALGGGVICDLVGFVAAAYMRGVPYVCVPTSLIGQVDAGVGGKVGVDFGHTKNLIGAFHHPVGILIDVSLLETLDQREAWNGLAEVIKVAVVGDGRLFEHLHSTVCETPSPVRRHFGIEQMIPFVMPAIMAKLRLIKLDPFECGDLNRALNFGHDIGHAVEAESGFGDLRHGEAVAIGMACCSRLASLRRLGDATPQCLLELLERSGYQVYVPRLKRDVVWRHLDQIRCVRGGSLRLVLPARLEAPLYVDGLTREEFLAIA